MSDIKVSVEYMAEKDSSIEFIGRGFARTPELFPGYFYQHEGSGLVLLEVEFGTGTKVVFRTLSATALPGATSSLLGLTEASLSKIIEDYWLEVEEGFTTILFDAIKMEVIRQGCKLTGYSQFSSPSAPHNLSRTIVKNREGKIFSTDLPWWQMQLLNAAGLNLDAVGYTNEGVKFVTTLQALEHEAVPPADGDINSALYTMKFPPCSVKGRGISEQQLTKLRNIRSRLNLDPAVKLSGLLSIGSIPVGLLNRSEGVTIPLIIDRYNDRIESIRIEKGTVHVILINQDDTDMLVALQQALKIQKMVKDL